MATAQLINNDVVLEKDGRELKESEVFHWGGKPLTVAQISMALKHYHNTKVRSAKATDKRRQRKREAKYLEQQSL